MIFGAEFNPADLLNYGAIGLVLVAILFGKLVPGYIYDRAVDDLTSCLEDTKKLRDSVTDKLIPALQKQVETNKEVIDAMRKPEQDALIKEIMRRMQEKET